MKMKRALLVPAMLLALAACSNGSQNSMQSVSDAKQPNVAATSAGSVVGTWTRQGSSDGVIRIEGDATLPAGVSLFWPATDENSHELQIVLNATGAGQLQVQSYYAKGKPSVVAQQYNVGSNTLIFNLPASVDGSRVTIVRAVNSSAATIESATLKASIAH